MNTFKSSLFCSINVMRICAAFVGLLWFGALISRAAITTNYVAQGTNIPDGFYTTWATAASNIQDAISVATGAGSIVLVSNGVYDVGGVTNWPSGSVLTNRVAITNAITVRSANNDPANTIIKGRFHSGDPGATGTITNGPAAVRCVYMTNGSSLIGFTLTNGATRLTNDSLNSADYTGAGVWSQSTNTVISNCVIAGNSAATNGVNCGGGGAEAGTLYNCTLSGNSASSGGGTEWSTLYNCVLSGNSANFTGNGGGAHYSTLYNCTVNNNSARNDGGGVYAYSSYNCTIVSNSAGSSGGGARVVTLYNCTLISNSAVNGGGAHIGSLPMYNCTVSGNSADYGGGIHGGRLHNCVVYFNSSPNGSNWRVTVSFTNTCTAPAATNGVGNTTANPLFVDTNTANYRLSANSPCVNTGTNLFWMTDPADVRSKDLDRHRRIDRFSGLPDMGCYEHVPQGTLFSVP